MFQLWQYLGFFFEKEDCLTTLRPEDSLLSGRVYCSVHDKKRNLQCWKALSTKYCDFPCHFPVKI